GPPWPGSTGRASAWRHRPLPRHRRRSPARSPSPGRARWRYPTTADTSAASCARAARPHRPCQEAYAATTSTLSRLLGAALITGRTGEGTGRDHQPEAPVGSAGMTVARSVALFVVAALFEIGGAWLVWQGIREHKGWIWIGAGVIALGLYGVVATFQSDDDFGRILAAYGGIFVAGSIAWGMVADGYRPDRYDVIGVLVCLAGMAVIMYAPRSH